MDARTAKEQYHAANTFYCQGRYKEALEVLTGLNGDFPNEKHIMYSSALCLNKLGNAEEASLLCERLVHTFDYGRAKRLLNRIQNAPPVAETDKDYDGMNIVPEEWLRPGGTSSHLNEEEAKKGKKSIAVATAMLLAVGMPVVLLLAGNGSTVQTAASPVIWPLSVLTLYLVMCYLLKRICQNAGLTPGVLIWVPLLQVAPLMRAAKMSFLWLLVLLVPVVGVLIVAAVLWVNLVRACGKSPWLAALIFVPVVQAGAMLYLAFARRAGCFTSCDSVSSQEPAQSPACAKAPSRTDSFGVRRHALAGTLLVVFTVLALSTLLALARQATSAEEDSGSAVLSAVDAAPNERADNVATAAGPSTLAADATLMLPGNVPLEMMRIPAGSFMMGRRPGETGGNENEDPRHEVDIEHDFLLGKYEVTQRQWLAVMGNWPEELPRQVVGDDRPAILVSWEDAQQFIKALNIHLSDTGQNPAAVRLPSEAEWEFAFRAGTTSRFYWGDDYSHAQINEFAWYAGNTDSVMPVGGKQPNAFGLYDMAGNVHEWVYFARDYDSGGAKLYLNGPESTYSRLARGGSWFHEPSLCRATYRRFTRADARSMDCGFRIAGDP